MEFRLSDYLKKLPPYLFVQIDQAKRQAIQEGRDLIDLGIGDPDQPTPEHIIKALSRAANDPANHHYALDAGMPKLRLEIARWYKKIFQVNLDDKNEILPLIGSKEGIAHLPFAFLNQGDVSLVPDPGYPVYANATLLAGGEPYFMPLRAENAFLPDLKEIPEAVLKKTKMMFLNYPNNPSAAVADKQFFQRVIDFALKYQIIVCSDLAYSQVCFDGYRAPSILEIDGAKEVAVEFHSLSKTYNMTGWRVGWVCGNQQVIAGLAKIKSNMDSGIFQAIQIAGIAALQTESEFTKQMCLMYAQRRDVLVAGLKNLGWNVEKPKASFYVWTKISEEINSLEFASIILKKADIVVTPGVGFGKYGEGYLRFALTKPEDKLKEAVKRLSLL
ncbi:MAG: LL-diaminopimelate aminotransferase [Candidatus Omnitrophota bacterium]|nr:MAG: LL-diaminopimelate aminotransferase [Candidatus Omnitrophota bacterium]